MEPAFASGQAEVAGALPCGLKAACIGDALGRLLLASTHSLPDWSSEEGLKTQPTKAQTSCIGYSLPTGAGIPYVLSARPGGTRH